METYSKAEKGKAWLMHLIITLSKLVRAFRKFKFFSCGPFDCFCTVAPGYFGSKGGAWYNGYYYLNKEQQNSIMTFLQKIF